MICLFICFFFCLGFYVLLEAYHNGIEILMTIFVHSYNILIILFQKTIMARSGKEIVTLVLLLVTFGLWFIAMVTPGWSVVSVETPSVSLIFNSLSLKLKIILISMLHVCLFLKCKKIKQVKHHKRVLKNDTKISEKCKNVMKYEICSICILEKKND